MKPLIAFLGTGIMGAPMCRHVIEAGYRVRVWNRTAAKTESLAKMGATRCPTAAEAVAGTDIVVVMLSTGSVVTDVLFGNDEESGIADRLQRDSIVVVMSSIPVQTSREHSERFKNLGIRYLDAPVSGGEKGAHDATLTMMVGGDADDLADARDLLSTMGRVTLVGPAGCGQLTKLANQVIVGITIDAVAEALILAVAGGADIAAVREALTGGFADSTILQQHGERMIGRNFEPGAKADIQLKDLRTSRELAETLGLDLPLLSLTESLYAAMCEHGRGDLDHSALYLEILDRAKAVRK